MQNIALEITNKLNEKKDDFISLIHSGNYWQSSWTKLLKEIITLLGQANNFYVNTSGLTGIADAEERLFDLVWSEMNYNGDKTTIIDIPLVLESEISKMTFGGFKEDFDKLFFAIHSTKVFVTRNINDDLLEECIHYAQTAVSQNKNIKHKDGIYLIIWHEINKKNFELKFIQKK